MSSFGSSFLLLAALIASPVPAPAQEKDVEPPPAGAGLDRPITRTIPRPELWPSFGRELGVSAEAAKALVTSLEDQGLFFRDAFLLALLAKVRADRLIEAGELPKEPAGEALRLSVEHLARMVNENAAGWVTLQREAKGEYDPTQLRTLQFKYNTLARPTARRAATSVRVASAPPAEAAEKQAPAAPKPTTQRRAARQLDPTTERVLPREQIHANLARELGVAEAVSTPLLRRLEAEMPLREAVSLLVVSGTVAQKRVEKGEISGTRAETLEKTVDVVLRRVREGEGWGTLAGAFGLNMPGVMVNRKAREILGQE
ncbi:MAG: hypothetical protein HY658_10460 [Actinobacteria bacterium]|nr:hypothetical protein [Actinomycetota bacterium]